MASPAENAATDPVMALQKIREASDWFDEQGYSLWASEMHWAHGKIAALLAQAEADLDAAVRERDSLHLELEASKHTHRKDNEHLIRERDQAREFIAYTLDEYGARMPNQWKAHARAALTGEGTE